VDPAKQMFGHSLDLTNPQSASFGKKARWI